MRMRKINHISCKCGVYTPYHLTAGGGEKMILSFVKVLQQITSCGIDLIVQKDNVCQNMRCLKQLAFMLSVHDLKWERITFKKFSAINLKREKKLNKHYLIWIHMSNSLLPTADAFGIFNVYHCQFPFDGLETPQNIHSLERLAEYQSVYLNSHYTLEWYQKFLEREFFLSRMQKTNNNICCLPGLTHFTPPFDFESKVTNVIDSAQKRRGRNIILVGRFFAGIQSKCQLEAIEAFNRISKVRKDVKLYLVGFMATGQEKYVEKVKQLAKLNTNVILKIGASKKELELAQSDSSIVWSITGLGSSSAENPADAEHFGIGLLEAMVQGIIPIVINKGGPVEIVEGLSFKSTVSSLNELVDSTISVLDSDDETLQNMQKEVLHSAYAHRSEGGFEDNFATIFSILGMKLSSGKEKLWQKFVIQMKKTDLENCNSKLILPLKSKKVALYVDNRHDSSIRTNVYRLMKSLGPSWGLHIIHSTLNEHYLKSSLSGVENVQFQNMQNILSLPRTSHQNVLEGDNDNPFNPRNSGSLYNSMWKSSLFWKSLGDVEKVFSFQSDSWFLGDMKQSDEAYDYIGSPWCLEGNSGFLSIEDRPNHAWHMLHDTRRIDLKFRVGNGGISLRSFKAMTAVVEQHGENTTAQENEDVFFVSYLNEDGFQVAEKNEASRFGLECFCKDIPIHNEIIQLWFRLLENKKEDFSTRTLSNYVLFMHKPEIVFSQLADNYVRSLSPSIANEKIHEKMIDVFAEFFMQ